MAKELIDLNGCWQFKEYPLSARRMRDLEGGNWLQTQVPCSIFTSLIETEQIDRKKIDTYPEEFSWVSEKSWVFRKTFQIGEEFFNNDKINLVFEGLDTVASIWLNEKLIARTDNMFIEHRFNVKPYIKSGKNNLLVKFDPAVEHAQNSMNRYGTLNESDFSNPCRAFLRKAQYQFGWDWCPAMPGCGIWRPVRLEGISKASIKHTHIRTIHCEENYADIRVAAELDTVLKNNLNLLISITGPDGNLVHKTNAALHTDSTSVVIRIEKPQLWFPAGYGKANLYGAELKLLSDGQELDVFKSEFGIRTIRLDCSPDNFGEKFQFIINDVPVCVKGSNWVPATIFPGSLGKTDYEELLLSARDANMNMLRVWGGGYYEDDAFYKICDKLGIMVWQDFMFACAYYPDRQWFLDKVSAEARSVIKKLRNHPSIVLWCGNNEVDWLHYTGFFGKGKKFHGRTIYHKLLPSLLTEFDSDRPYIPTTPFSKSKDLNNSSDGTIHNWNVWSNYEPVSQYIKPVGQTPRFVAEFGFQGMPEKETIAQFCPEEQVRLSSRVLEKHNYQVNGNSRIYRYLGDLFGSAGNIDSFIYLSQLTQARAIKSYVEFLRANRHINSGVLFWQFEDCCPAISWSSVDYLKRPKALYYYAKRFFAPVLITVVPEFEEIKTRTGPRIKSLSAVVVNDTHKTFIAKMSCRLIDLHGVLLDLVELPVSVEPFSASRPVKVPQNITFCPNPENSVLHLQVEKDGTAAAENLYLFLPDKYIEWPSVDIKTGFSKTGPDSGTITLSSDKVAKDVKVEIEGEIKLTDNYVDLMPNSQYKVEVKFDGLTEKSMPAIKLTSTSSAIQKDKHL